MYGVEDAVHETFIKIAKNMSKIGDVNAQETREIDGSLAFVYLYLDEYAMEYYEHEEYVYLITAEKLDSEGLFSMIDNITD